MPTVQFVRSWPRAASRIPRSDVPRRGRFASATRAYNNSFKPVANCIPGPNLRRLLVGLDVEGEPFRLAP